MFTVVRYLGVSLFILLLSGPAWACDSCALYHSLEQRVPKDGTLHLSLTEQFTEYGKLQNNGSKVDNTAHQRLSSSHTIAAASYDLDDRLSFEAILPYINRRYTSAEGQDVTRGTVAGIGDLTLLGLYVPYRWMEQDSNFIVQLFGGLKVPTGDAGELSPGEHADEHEEEGEEHEEHSHMLRHDGETHSAIHGHDLALGSGSWDFPIGAALFYRSGRFFAEAATEYLFRTKGSYDYHYGNELQWRTGPAYYVFLHHDTSVALKLNVGGQYKPKDTIDGENDDSTSINAVYWGPELNASIGENLGAFVAYDRPWEIENSGLQAVMSYRLRAGLRYRF